MPRKSTKKRAVKRPTKPRLLRYGYWDYPDPVPQIRKLLAKKPELLQEFEELLEEEDFLEYSSVEEWAAKPGVPAKARALVARAAPKGDAELFGEVEVASGSGPDVGSMIGFTPVLYARRARGWIHYRTNEDIPEPDSTEKPLPLSEVCELFLGDLSYGPEALAEDALSAYLTGEPTPESVASAVDDWGASAQYESEFYDLEGEWAETVAMTKEAALQRFDEEEKDQPAG